MNGEGRGAIAGNPEALQIARDLSELLLSHRWFLATAESCTGGGLGYLLTALPGSSAWYAGGLITYSNAFKGQWLGVNEQLITQRGAVSAEVAAAMAAGVAERGQVETSIAITGVAGPDGGTALKPVGLVWVATTDPQRGLRTSRLDLQGDRGQVRERAILAALNFFVQGLS